MDEQTEQNLIEMIDFIEEIKDYKLKRQRLFAYDLMQKELKAYWYLREYVRLLKEQQIDLGRENQIETD